MAIHYFDFFGYKINLIDVLYVFVMFIAFYTFIYFLLEEKTKDIKNLIDECKLISARYTCYCYDNSEDKKIYRINGLKDYLEMKNKS